MKNLKLVCLLLFAFTANITFAQELTLAQKKFQTELFNFLKEEGFAPYIDKDDNSINFKKEGSLHWIQVMGESSFFISFQRSGYSLSGEKGLQRRAALLACNDVNLNKPVAKMYCGDKSVSISVELYTKAVEDFKQNFYSNMRALEAAESEFVKKYDEYSKQ